MKNWYQTKISYLKQAENGSIFRKSEEYMLQALSFTEAESNLQAILEEYIGEYSLKACKQSNVDEVVIDEAKEKFFKLKLQYISTDESSEKTKIITENFLVQADTLQGAIKKVEERMTGTIMDWEIASVSKTNILDVFPYIEEKIK